MEFKKLSAVEAVDAVSDAASVLIEENGVIKRISKDKIGTNLKNLSTVETVSDTVNVLIEENGVIKKAPKTAVGGGSTEWDAVIEINSSVKKVANITAEHLAIASGNYNNIYEKISSGKHPDVRFKWYYDDEGDFYIDFQAGSVVYDGYNDVIGITGLYVYGAKVGTLNIHLRDDNTFSEVFYTEINS